MKKASIVMLAFLLVISLCGCEVLSGMVSRVRGNLDDLDEYERNAKELRENTTFRNTFLGLEFTAPQGWWVYDCAPENFTTKPDGQTFPSDMSVYEEDGSSFIYLIDLGTLQDSRERDQSDLYIYAQKLKNENNLADYTQAIKELTKGKTDDEDDREYVFTKEESRTIGSIEFNMLYFDVGPDMDNNYLCVFLLAPLNNGYFLTMETSYWPENDSALEEMCEILAKNLKFSSKIDTDL